MPPATRTQTRRATRVTTLRGTRLIQLLVRRWPSLALSSAMVGLEGHFVAVPYRPAVQRERDDAECRGRRLIAESAGHSARKQRRIARVNPNAVPALETRNRVLERRCRQHQRAF